MNKELTQRVLGINVPNLKSRDLGLEPVKITDRQAERLMDYPKHVNSRLIKKVSAFRVTYKRRWTNVIRIDWPDVFMVHYLTANKFAELIG